MTPLTPITLSGRVVALVPMAEHHVEPLAMVGLDESLWQWTATEVRSLAGMRRYVLDALAARDSGTALPFVVTLAASGAIVGSTRLANHVPEHGRVEIGWSWIATPWQRTAVNTEAKLLLLGHAFEVMGCRRVEIKTDALNQRSRAAILRLGATEEGTLRRHMTTQSGRVRDTVYFSIIREEWPTVRQRLDGQLDGQLDGRLDGRLDGQLDGRLPGRLDGARPRGDVAP